MPTRALYDLPTIYDVLHSQQTAWEVTGVERIARAAGVTNGRTGCGTVWLEPACGTARYLAIAAARGRTVVGTDLNPAMIAYAARRLERFGRNARVAVGDMRSVDRTLLPARGADVAFNLINTIRHLDSDAAMLEHLESISACLRPGGVYIVGLSTTIAGFEPPSEDTWTGARGRLQVSQLIQYIPPTDPADRTERVISAITASRPRGDELIDSSYTLRTYTLEQWYGLVERSTLRIAAVVDEQGRDLDPPPIGYAIYVLATV